MKRNLQKLLWMTIVIFSMCVNAFSQGTVTNIVSGAASWTGSTYDGDKYQWTTTVGGFTATLAQENAQQAPTEPAEHMRQYPGAVLTVDGGTKNITTIVLPYTGSGTYAHALTVNTGTVNCDESTNTVTWTGSASKIVFTTNFTSGHNRYESIDIYTDGMKPGNEQVDYSNTQATAYKASEAYDLLTNDPKANSYIYITGYVSYVKEFNKNYGSITYYISDDASRSSKEFMIYSGKGMLGADGKGIEFSSKDDIQLGDKVTVYGQMKLYGADRELNMNSYIVDYQSKASKPIENGDYYIRNMGEFTYMASANSWGTQLSLKDGGDLITISKLSKLDENGNATYSFLDKDIRVVSAGKNIGQPNDNSSFNLFCDANEMPFTLTRLTVNQIDEINANSDKEVLQRSKDYYYISYMHPGAQERYYMSTGEPGVSNVSTVQGIYTHSSINEVWEILTKEELSADLRANASDNNPMSATSFISNPDFTRNHGTVSPSANNIGWTINWLTGGGNTQNKGSSDKEGNFVVESWQKGFDWSQTLTGIPNGIYELKVYGAVHEYTVTGNDFPYLYAETNGKQVTSTFGKMTSGENAIGQLGDAFNNGRYGVTPIENIEVRDNTIKIGVHGNRTDTWTVWDNFQLTYYGSGSLTLLKAQLKQLKEVASALLDKKMEGILKTNLEKWANATPTAETQAAYSDIVDQLSIYVTRAEESVKTYEDFKAYNERVTNEFKSEQAKTYYFQTNKMQEKYDNATVSSIGEVETVFKSAFLLRDEPGLDMTKYAIVNPSFETGDLTGWELYEGTGGDTGVKPISNATYAMTPSDGEYVFNTWNGGNVGYPISQTVTGLANGKYYLQAQMTGLASGEVYITGNDITGTLKSDGNDHTGQLNRVEVEVRDGKIEIKLHSKETWFKADDIHLIYKEGFGLDDYYIGIAKKTNEALALLNTPMNKDAKSFLNSAWAMGNAVSNNPNTFTNETQLQNIEADLNKAVADAIASAKIYEDVNSYFKKAKEKLDESGSEQFNKLCEEIQKGYTEGTITDGVTEIETEKEMYVESIKAQSTKDADMTEAVLNFDCNNGFTAHDPMCDWNTARVAPIGWSIYDNKTHSIIENVGCFHINTWSNEGEYDATIEVPFTELWDWQSGTDKGPFSNDVLIMHDEETGYRPGKYEITVRVRLGDIFNNGNHDQWPHGFDFYANDVVSTKELEEHRNNPSNGTDFFYKEDVIRFIVGEDGIINFGFKLKDANFSWLCFKQIGLKYLGDGYDEEEIEELLATVPDLTKPMNKDVKAEVLSAMDAFQKTPNINTGKVLIGAIDKANASIKLYKEIKDDMADYGEKAQDLIDGGNKFNDLLVEVMNGYNAGTLTENTVRDIYLEAFFAQGAGADFTELIINPDFEEGTTRGWTVQPSGDTGARLIYDPSRSDPDTYKTVAEDGADLGMYVFNTWSVGYPITQTITGIPNGKYIISAYGATDHGNGVFLLGNGMVSEPVDPDNKFDGKYMELEVEVKDNTLTLGAVSGKNLTYDGISGNWYKVDNFRLTFNGATSSEDYLVYIQDAIKNAEKNYLAYPMNKQLKDKLQKAVDAGKKADISMSVSDIQKLIDDINTAIEPTVKSIEVYASIYAYQEQAEALDEDGMLTYYDLAADVISAYEEGTITDGKKELEKVKSVIVAAVKAQTTPESVMTLAIVNNGFEDGITGWKADKGYSCPSIQMTRTSNWTLAEGKQFAYLSARKGTSRNLHCYQAIDGLPAGLYAIRFVADATIEPTSSYTDETHPLYINCCGYSMKITKEKQQYEFWFSYEGNGSMNIDVKGVLQGEDPDKGITANQQIRLDNFELIYKGEEPDFELETRPMNKNDLARQTKAYNAYFNDETGYQLDQMQELVEAIQAAKKSADTYAMAQFYIDSASHYLERSNVYTKAAYDLCKNMTLTFQSQLDTREMSNEDAAKIMDKWMNRGANGENFYGFNSANANGLVPSQTQSLHPEYPILYYIKDAWTIKRKDAATSVYSDGNFHVNTWSVEGNAVNSSGMTTPFIEYWTMNNPNSEANRLPAATINATAINLAPGLYTLTIDTRVIRERDMSTQELHGVTITAKTPATKDKDLNAGVYTTDLCDATKGTRSGEGGGRCVYGTYSVDSIIVRAKDKGTVDISIDIADDTNVTWLSYKFAHLSKVRDLEWFEEDEPASADSIAKLDSLIAVHNKKVIGFGGGEYATYANVEQIRSYRSAKSYMKGTEILADDVTEYIKALQKPWHENFGDTNAIYNPNFSFRERLNNCPITAWTAIDETVTNPKTGMPNASSIIMESRIKNFNNIYIDADGNSQKFSTAARMRFDGTTTSTYCSPFSKYEYGSTDGYEMPLKENQAYSFKAEFGSYADDKQGNAIAEIIDPDGNIIMSEILDCHVNAADSMAQPNKSKFYFTTEKAGDYKIRFRNANTSNRFDLIISNMELLREPTVMMQIASSCHYGTFIAPFDVQIPNGIKAYAIASINDESQVVTDSLGYTSSYTTINLVDHIYYSYKLGSINIKADTKLSDGTIPAHVPVIIYRENLSNGSFVKAYGGNATTTTRDLSYKHTGEFDKDVPNAWLQGTYGEVDENGEVIIDKQTLKPQPVIAPNGSYVLQKHKALDACFYEVDWSVAKPKVAAYRAYLVLANKSNGARVRMCAFDSLDDLLENATIITDAEDSTDAPEIVGIYSVSGAPQKSLQKGVNIIKMSDGTTRKQLVK